MTTNFELFFKRIKKAVGVESDTDLAKFLNINKSTLSMWKSREKVDYDLLFTKIEHTNFHWLITGQEAVSNYKTEEANEITSIYKLRTDRNHENQIIPLYNLEATAGLVDLFQNQGDQTPIDTIRIPNLPKCDGAVFVTGDSMYPLLKSGDIVAYKQIYDFGTEIFWGEMYLISVEVAGEEFVSVKYIQKSDKGEKYVKLVSQNQHHQPKDVPLEKVRALALIKASIRINSMR